MAENLNVCTIQILTQIDVNYRVDFRNLNLKNVELRGRYQLFSDLNLPSIHKELR
jgi:hypothetical protein